MELAMRWQRFQRALVGILIFGLGLGAAVFIFSNVSPVDIHWRVPSSNGLQLDWTLRGVSLWLLAAIALVVGALLGYLYQTPARLHHFREHMRHRHRVHELEHELKELRVSLDKLLMMDGGLAAPAALMAPIEHGATDSTDESERDPRLPGEPADVEVLAAKPVKEEVEAAVAAPSGEKAARPRRRFFGGLKAEVAEIKLPAAIPATIVATPRRGGKAGNGRRKPAAKAAPKTAAKPVRKAVAKKPG